MTYPVNLFNEFHVYMYIYVYMYISGTITFGLFPVYLQFNMGETELQ